MTQNEKDLLLKDLCARLPYGVKFPNAERSETVLFIDTSDNEVWINGTNINDVKPYLFPLSSMTEEQKKEYNRWKHEVPVYHYEYGDLVEGIELFDSPESFEYLIENHFDYYGLIPLGLAIDATNLNIY